MLLRIESSGTLTIKAENSTEGLALRGYTRIAMFPACNGDNTEILAGTLFLEDEQGRDLIDEMFEVHYNRRETEELMKVEEASK